MEERQETAHPLGTPLRVFRAKLAIRLVVVVCGIILLCGGGWLCVEMGPTGPGPYVITLSLFILAFAYLLSKSRYTVCPDGMILERFGRRKLCRWSAVVEIVDRHTKQGIVTSRSCVFRGKTGPRLELPSVGYDFDGMVALIREQARQRQIPWREEHINAKEQKL
jgi:hypothetical protein